MTKALLLVTLGIYFSRMLLMTAGGNTPTVTCTPGKTVMTKVNAAGSIIVKCPDVFIMRVSYRAPRHPSEAPVFSAPSLDEQGKDIQDFCPGASWVKLPGSAGCQVDIPQLPPNRVKFYFPCAKTLYTDDDAEGDFCFIGIEVAAAEDSGLNICATDGGRIYLSIENANEPLKFACRNEIMLRPSDRKKTYSASCNREVNLLEDAALTEEKGQYELTVQKLPAKRIEICYLCMGQDEASACEVHIVVPQSKISGAVSESVTARTAAALGLTLAAVGFLRLC